MPLNSDLDRTIKVTVFLVMLIAGLYFGKPFFVPLAFGILLSMLFLPVCNWFENKKIPRGWASLLCTLLLALFISGVGAVLWWQGKELAKEKDQIEQNVTDIIEDVQGFVFKNFGISRYEQKQKLDEQQGSMFQAAFSVTLIILDILFNIVLILVFVFILLFYRAHFKKFILKYFKRNQKGEAESILENTALVSQQYLWGLTKAIIILWIAYGIAFSIIGVKSPLLFAFICGLLEIIPVVGTLIGVTITIFGSFAQGADSSVLLGIVISYAVIQFIQSYFLEPVIIGGQVEINAFIAILALLAGELIWGIPGMILAIPLTGMLKILFDRFEELKPIGFLFGDINEGDQKGKKKA